jgi:hypothetical protein
MFQPETPPNTKGEAMAAIAFVIFILLLLLL